MRERERGGLLIEFFPPKLCHRHHLFKSPISVITFLHHIMEILKYCILISKYHIFPNCSLVISFNLATASDNE